MHCIASNVDSLACAGAGQIPGGGLRRHVDGGGRGSPAVQQDAEVTGTGVPDVPPVRSANRGKRHLDDEVTIEDWVKGMSDDDNDEAREGSPMDYRAEEDDCRYVFQEAEASMLAAHRLAREAEERQAAAKAAHKAAGQQTRIRLHEQLGADISMPPQPDRTRVCFIQPEDAGPSRPSVPSPDMSQIEEISKRLEAKQQAMEELRAQNKRMRGMLEAAASRPQSRQESGLGHAAWEPLPTVTVTPAVQPQHGIPATPSTTLRQFRLHEFEEEERSDPKIDELARRLQIARHERAKVREAERREEMEGRMFDELMHGPAKHADLHKRATFEMLTCGVGESPAKAHAWASSLSDYFAAIDMQESEKIEFAAHHTRDLARA